MPITYLFSKQPSHGHLQTAVSWYIEQPPHIWLSSGEFQQKLDGGWHDSGYVYYGRTRLMIMMVIKKNKKIIYKKILPLCRSICFNKNVFYSVFGPGA